ncbi:hypothetical protein ACEWY4_022149 [Coilia grayii]|uniref:Uncharacterized protein n=1 Tax=Coilia grayii TaxID=363190 RepID=A0ABD1J565_9TELE
MHGEEKGPKSVTVPEPGPEPVPQPKPEPDLEPDPEPVPQPDPEPDLQPDPEPVPQPDPEPDLEPDPEPDLEPDSQPKPMVVLGEKYEMKHGTKTVRLYTVIPEVVKVHCESLTRMLYDKKLMNKTERSSVEDCDVILAFCPVVSRLGTDVEAALKNIPVQADKETRCPSQPKEREDAAVGGCEAADGVVVAAFGITVARVLLTVAMKIFNLLWQLVMRLAQIIGVERHLQALARVLRTIAMKMFNLLWPLVMGLAEIIGVKRHLQALTSRLRIAPAGSIIGPPVIQVFTILIGKTLGSHESFLELLATQVTLERVDSVMECDVILAFCPIVSRVGTDIVAALPKIPDRKPAILVVLHHTFDTDYVIPNTSRFTADKNIPTVDCLMTKKRLKAFVIESGKTLNSRQQFVERLSSRAEEVQNADQCDVILAFCPIVSRVGTDIEAAVKLFEACCPTPKPIILVVLHHTFNREYVVPDCKKYVGGDRVSCIINGLFHDDEGLLKCCEVNTQAIEHALVKLKELKKDKKKKNKETDDSEGEDSKKKEEKKKENGDREHKTQKREINEREEEKRRSAKKSKGEDINDEGKTMACEESKETEPAERGGGKRFSQMKHDKKSHDGPAQQALSRILKKKLKIFVIESGKTLNSRQQFVERLSSRAEEVHNADQCDVILAFCPIVSRVGTDIEAAVKLFEACCPTSKPIILVVLHHTFNREYVVPDCKKYVGGDRVSCIVNGLFHDDEGLLKCCEVNTQAIEHALVKLKELKKDKKKKNKETDDSEDEDSKKSHDGPAQQALSRILKKKLKIFVIESGKTLNSRQQFVERLSSRAEEVHNADQCDVILAFCPIVSRVGTDIEAAVKLFEACCPTSKPIILVVLHHTFNREYVVPDCKKYVGGDRVSCIVNGLFHDDEGLLKCCEVNTQAIEHTLVKLKELKKDKKKKNKETDDSEDEDSKKEEEKKKENGDREHKTQKRKEKNLKERDNIPPSKRDEQKDESGSLSPKKNKVGPEVVQEGHSSKEQMHSPVQTTRPKQSQGRQYNQQRRTKGCCFCVIL